MDEPLSNLDAKLRAHTRAEIVKLQRQLAITTLYVTHDQIEAMTMADRIVVIDHGVIQQVGTPQELYTKPANIFVAGFIGTPPMNFIPGKILGGRFVNKELGINLAVPAKVGCQEGKSIIIGIRPEHLQIATTKQDEGMELVVMDTQFIGSRFYVLFKLGSLVITGSLPDYVPNNAKEWVSFSMENVHFFDGKTTMRLEV